jgi:hypothetical protein
MLPTTSPFTVTDASLTRVTTARTGRSSRAVRCGRESGRISGVPTLHLSQDDAADELLGRDPLALLIGMLLDRHVRTGTWGLLATRGYMASLMPRRISQTLAGQEVK